MEGASVPVNVTGVMGLEWAVRHKPAMNGRRTLGEASRRGNARPWRFQRSPARDLHGGGVSPPS